MTTAKVKLPPKLVPVFTPARGEVQYRGAYGGRGSGKSFSFALMAAIWGYSERLRILCTRDLQVSIKESFHAELKNAIRSTPWLDAAYDVGVDYIRGENGTEFLFRGLRHSMSSIKSTAQIDLTIVEEAEDVPEQAWEDLEPTVLRTPKSEIWTIWNPKKEGSPVDVRLRQKPPTNSRIVQMNWNDNPFFTEGLEHNRQRDMKLLDPQRYSHIWEGAYLRNSDAQVFANKYRIAELIPKDDWDGPYYGLDFGFAQDPTAAVRVWINNDQMYIEHEAGSVQLELDATAQFVKQRVPGIEDYTIRADSARPESISYLKRNGLPRIEGVKKWQGSVEDGIQFIRSFREVVIHPRCSQTIDEFNNYSYKVDRHTKEIKPDVVDAYNHYIDAIRYALQPMIKNKFGKLAPMPVQFSY